jgi:ketosteroid isomerase-like protein
VRTTVCAVLVAVLSVVAGPVRADDQAEIRALYTKVGKAFKNRDVAALKALTTPDFVNIDHGKKTRWAEFEPQLRQSFQGGFTGQIEVKPLRMTISGKKATVDSQMKVTVSQPDQQGKSHTFSQIQASRETLLKGVGGWKIASSTNGKTTMILDGKPFDPSSARRGGMGAPPPR